MAEETSGILRYGPGDVESLREAVDRAVLRATVTDLHTHLYAPAFGDLLLWGIDELLTYHYLIAEAIRATRIDYDRFWAMSKPEQAGFIWQALFIDRTPVSEACRGVVTALRRLGLDCDARNLDDYRAWFAEQDPAAHVDRVLDEARLDAVVMTNDPFDDAERPTWERGWNGHPRFRAALRIDPLLTDWPAACQRLRGWGYAVEEAFGGRTFDEVRRFLTDWVARMDALYLAVSLPPDFAYPGDGPVPTLLADAVLPAAAEAGVPFAMMVGVKRGVNPRLRLAGDGVGKCDIKALEHLWSAFPDNRFMVTLLSRENQHELCVAARKFPHVFLFGCWWFLNNPSLIEELTRMRLELLGLSFAPQHSDARILEQVLYKWDHSREVLARVLQDKYADALRAGWSIGKEAIQRDVDWLLRGCFRDFLGRSQGD
jgi:hypothetical protein